MSSQPPACMPCSLSRRCGAIVYDSVVMLALWFIATALLLPLTGATAIEPGQPYYPLYPPYLVLVNWLYLAVSWRYAGQTLGMKAWRVFLLTEPAGRISWYNAVLRYLVATAGLATAGAGFVSSLFNEDRLAWHDRASRSRLVFQPKKMISVVQ